MPSPPITLYMTTIASQPVLRQRQGKAFPRPKEPRLERAKKIPFNTYDLASDEEAKRLWRRKAPLDKQQLPGILVGGKFPGNADLLRVVSLLHRSITKYTQSPKYQTPTLHSEDAVEHDELDIFLRLKENWDPAIDEDRPPPEVKPVGVPGAASPMQMTPDHLKPKFYPKTQAPSPLKGKSIPVNKRVGELDMGDELSGFGLQGVKVTEDELRDLIADLGLDGDEAGDLAAGLSEMTTPVQGLKLGGKTSSVQELDKKKKEEAAKAVTAEDASFSKNTESAKINEASEDTANQEAASKPTAREVEEKLDIVDAKP
ncbi:hypothetical protein JR316_0000669 [Psilocybe cubensis]|uniref:Uncharacterized protein n=2 Tax=Psilocybe cubensis TaxID=181762 RepID=A0A8H7YAV2_PSICU|nr:hypothetical protein JR316_0000669 [Psilocybe cubensis]KAH9486604.1 hypothetical protein JR316_0000669 [Psilocybe cubensis]